jgi:hypothetical protein
MGTRAVRVRVKLRREAGRRQSPPRSDRNAAASLAAVCASFSKNLLLEEIDLRRVRVAITALLVHFLDLAGGRNRTPRLLFPGQPFATAPAEGR